ncbi:lipoprotein [Pilimelia terevasa]|uniref:Lipoprotein n=1 Tax=Pilimelia terevasa TaxID=53372 RepID=A0A8J3BM12_9ACTN|nr:DUF4349 domain-containing protein [Pilimelia terevasa]GGK30920.1 lipoprotein [Pilimelia terevasa]
MDGFRARRYGVALAAGAALLAVAAGCTVERAADERTGSGVSMGQEDRREAAGAPAPAGRPAAAGLPAAKVVDTRSVVRTGTLAVRVDRAGDVETAAARAVALTQAAGGYVGEDRRDRGTGAAQATLTVRVPAAGFEALLGQLAGVGREESRQIGTQDVTEEVVDVDARLASQQASVNRTRAMLAQARTVAELVSLEGELARREAELASLQARKRSLADRTALSTVTLEIRGPGVAAAAPREPGFGSGLAAGWRALVSSLRVLAAVLGLLAPWVLLLGGPAWLTARWLRRRRARPAAAAAPQ